MCKSKSKHIRSIGRLSVLPGICGINEPIIFGTPIVLNPILSIPFLIMPCLSAGLGYLVQSMGLVSLGYIVDPSLHHSLHKGSYQHWILEMLFSCSYWLLFLWLCTIHSLKYMKKHFRTWRWIMMRYRLRLIPFYWIYLFLPI